MQLPAYVFKKYGVQPFCQAVPSEARTLFKAILDFFAFYGANYGGGNNSYRKEK